MPDLTQYVQLGGQVVVVLLFLNYLTKRDDKWVDSLKTTSDSYTHLAIALQKLTDTVIKNTSATKENKPAVEDNTNAMEKNTDIIKKTNGHGKKMKVDTK